MDTIKTLNFPSRGCKIFNSHVGLFKLHRSHWNYNRSGIALVKEVHYEINIAVDDCWIKGTNIMRDHKLRVSYNHFKTASSCYGNSQKYSQRRFRPQVPAIIMISYIYQDKKTFSFFWTKELDIKTSPLLFSVYAGVCILCLHGTINILRGQQSVKSLQPPDKDSSEIS